MNEKPANTPKPDAPTVLNQGYLEVSPIHKVWYSEHGNPEGVPVIVLHGGPGAGCDTGILALFDLDKWRVVLLDQRGAGKSQPFAELQDNTTTELVADLEKLRAHLGIAEWVVFGGSWGSTLALAYGQAHPARVMAFVLRGIFFPSEDNVNQICYGIRDIFPDYWQELNDYLPAEEQGDIVKAYYERVTGDDPKLAMEAARVLMAYDLRCGVVEVEPKQLEKLLANDNMIFGVATLFLHYAVNQFFMAENQLIDNMSQINTIPLTIVHGRYDVITLPRSAHLLHQLWPGSTLEFVPMSGHAASDNRMPAALRRATDQLILQLELIT